MVFNKLQARNYYKKYYRLPGNNEKIKERQKIVYWRKKLVKMVNARGTTEVIGLELLTLTELQSYCKSIESELNMYEECRK